MNYALIDDDINFCLSFQKEILNYITSFTYFLNYSDFLKVKDDFDIVFLDIVMPKKDGITATKEIIEIDPDAKVVMASSIGNKKNLKEALIAGAKEFVQKPIDFSQVTKIIEALLKGGN